MTGAGPLRIETLSMALKSMGSPLPLLVMPVRRPLVKVSAVWPRMLGLAGAPKFVVV